jgi:HlyD family type I secretion membrane fusion protein
LNPADLADLTGRDRLALSIHLEERSGNGGWLFFMILLITAVGASVVWAAQTQIREEAVASGEVLPIDETVNVYHLEGGIVASLPVREGSSVRKGQVLLRLSDRQLTPERNQLKTRLTNLELRRQQLLTVLGKPTRNSGAAGLSASRVQQAQDRLLQAKLESLQSQIRVVERQIAGKRAEIAKFNAQERSFQKEIALLNEQANIYKPLEAEGAVPHIQVLQAQRQVAAAQTSLAELQGTRSISQQTLEEAQANLIDLKARVKLENSQRLVEVENESSELRQSIKRVEDQLRRLTVAAPLDGIVQSLQVKNVGGVVAPGSVAAQLVPVGEELLVKARLDPKDIGLVKVGQPAEIKVQAYDYTRFGTIEGTVKSISPSTFTDQKTGRSFYNLAIKLKQSGVGADPQQNPLEPGMTVTADIITGQKSLLQYLLGPAFRNLTDAFKER